MILGEEKYLIARSKPRKAVLSTSDRRGKISSRRSTISHNDRSLAARTASKVSLMSFTYFGSECSGTSSLLSTLGGIFVPNRSTSNSPASSGGRYFTLGRQDVSTCRDHSKISLSDFLA